MTLILSFAYRGCVIQVVDRLVTRTQQGVPNSRFDTQFNKTVVYAARDEPNSVMYKCLSISRHDRRSMARPTPRLSELVNSPESLAVFAL